MASKHPTSEEIQAMLREGHFGESRPLPPADPLTPTQMFLEISRIRPYDRNPRRERNPLFVDIKESIRAQGGLNTPLTITRRPGEDAYTVEAGGNTRLTILHELWVETQDERFYRIHCLFRPWVSEAHVLTAHLIENDKRGALTFIDKSLAVRELRNLLQAERHDPLSQRQLVELLRERGFGMDQSMISRIDYAVDVLLPLIPEALRSGLGPKPMRQIRRLENACRGLWTDRGQAPETFVAIFEEVLATHDGPAWDLTVPQQALEQCLAERLGLSIKEIRLEVDARLARGGEDETILPTPQAAPSPANPRPRGAPSDTSAVPRDRAIAAPNPRAGSGDEPRSQREPIATTPPSSDAALPEIDFPDMGANLDDRREELQTLRSQMYTVTLTIANRHGLHECLCAAPDFGMGFLMDLPTEPLIPVAGQPDFVPQMFRQWLWWLLLSLSEEAVAPERMAHAPEGLLLRTLILDGDDAKALALVGEPDWKSLGHEFLSNPAVPEETVDDLLDVVRICRGIRRLAGDRIGSALWQAPR